MSESNASRTLVKSPPELWSEVSSAESLQRHMDRFGEIRITKLEPETAVAWEGEHTRGTIRLEPSGWGTKVSLTATAVGSSGQEEAGHPTQEEAGHPTQEEAGHPTQEEVDQDGHPDATLAQPYETVEAEVRELAAFVARNNREVDDRWSRRMARRVRRWFRSGQKEDTGVLAGPPAAQDEAPVAEVQRRVGPAPEPVAPEPEAPQPEPTQPEAPQPEATQPEAPQPEAPQPEATQPEAPQPEAPQHEATESEATEPQSTEPEATEPELTETGALAAVLDSLGQAHHRPYSRV